MNDEPLKRGIIIADCAPSPQSRADYPARRLWNLLRYRRRFPLNDAPRSLLIQVPSAASSRLQFTITETLQKELKMKFIIPGWSTAPIRFFDLENGDRYLQFFSNGDESCKETVKPKNKLNKRRSTKTRKLTKYEKQVADMHFSLGMSQGEIAHELGKFKQSICRTLKNVKEKTPGIVAHSGGSRSVRAWRLNTDVPDHRTPPQKTD